MIGVGAGHDITADDIDFARHVAYKAGGIWDVDDRVSDAYLGLCEASKDYDHTYGASFRTWSYSKIRGAMQEGYRKRSHWFAWQPRFGMAREPLQDASYLPDTDELIDFIGMYKRLGPIEQAALRMRMYGYEILEIAAKLNVRRETVWQWLRKIKV